VEVHREPVSRKRDSGIVHAEFLEFLRVDRNLAETTVRGHNYRVTKLFDFLAERRKVNPLDPDVSDLRAYLGRADSVYMKQNALNTLRLFYRDYLRRGELVASFRSPKRPFKPKRIPTRDEVKEFYEALESRRARASYLFYATTGLRRSEALELTFREVDFDLRMAMPDKGTGSTKNTWVTFWNDEADRELRDYLAGRDFASEQRIFPFARSTLKRDWSFASKETDIGITPQKLRQFFSTEMARLGVPDRYVDAFCGRTPKSVLARHYSDYSPRVLKEIYDGAGLRVLTQ
jgi:integrase